MIEISHGRIWQGALGRDALSHLRTILLVVPLVVVPVNDVVLVILVNDAILILFILHRARPNHPHFHDDRQGAVQVLQNSLSIPPCIMKSNL